MSVCVEITDLALGVLLYKLDMRVTIHCVTIQWKELGNTV